MAQTRSGGALISIDVRMWEQPTHASSKRDAAFFVASHGSLLNFTLGGSMPSCYSLSIPGS
jgi:hypothetical protein